MSKENIVLTVINDGDGSECGYTYQQRCVEARRGTMAVYKMACAVRDKYGGTYRDARDAAQDIRRYYINHVAECAKHIAAMKKAGAK